MRPTLDPTALGFLPHGVQRPAYDRAEVTVGIVHLGAGGFHRSHQAAFLDRLMSDGRALDWGICAVGTLPADRLLAGAMRAQDGLYTLAIKAADGSVSMQVIGSVVEYLLAPDDPEAVVERMTDPRVRIVSLTVTEGGYFRDFATGAFDAAARAVQADAAHPTRPETVFGMIVEALRRRRERGVEAFTVMSCDNVAANGEVCRAAVVGLAALFDPELAAWIDRVVAFPSSMVDRITPRTSDSDRAAVESAIGVVDACPVVCEPFAQWVLEDDFPAGRPPLEEAGVQLVQDVEPYELMKLRLLNCTHQAMCYFGSLMGYCLVHEAADDPDIAYLLRRFMEEATPSLPPVAGIDLDAYKATLLERYSNRAIRDPLARLCTDGSDRIPNWLVPMVRELLAATGRAPMGAVVIASWAAYCEGVDDAGRTFDFEDRRHDELTRAASQQDADPLAFLRQTELFGELADDRRFTDDYVATLMDIQSKGAGAALRIALGRTSGSW